MLGKRKELDIKNKKKRQPKDCRFQILNSTPYFKVAKDFVA
jgi:hypothetical protein